VIAVDSNVILRYVLQDDPAQAAKSVSLLRGAAPVLVTDVVLVETIWTLKGPKYRVGKDDLLKVIEALFQEPNVRFEDAAVVWRALQDYRLAQPVKVGGKKKSADFADALIVNKARSIARQVHDGPDGPWVYTFDVAAQVIEGTRAP
jgi:predicted nucleic-acid-binding protein